MWRAGRWGVQSDVGEFISCKNRGFVADGVREHGDGRAAGSAPEG